MLVVHLFAGYVRVGLCRFFSSSWCRRLAAASACGSFHGLFCLPFFIVVKRMGTHF